MENLQTILNHYLNFCSYQKRLDAKTIKAYRIDLSQFLSQTSINAISEITPEILEKFIWGQICSALRPL